MRMAEGAPADRDGSWAGAGPGDGDGDDASPAYHLAQHPRPLLLGTPDLPFSVRYTLSCAESSRMASWVAVAVIASILVRVPSEHRFLRVAILSQGLMGAFDLLWRRACRGQPNGGCHARWHDYIILPFMALIDIVMSRRLVVVVILSQFAPGRAGLLGALHHFAVLAAASRFPSNFIVWSQWARISVALPAQCLMVFHFMRNNEQACATPSLSGGPASAQLTHSIAFVLRALRFGSLTPPLPRPLTTNEECRTILAYLQLTLGLVAPALVHAVTEARFYKLHARQRRELGLPAESGWRPRVYGTINSAFLGLEWLYVVVLSWVLLGLLYLLAQALSFDDSDSGHCSA